MDVKVSKVADIGGTGCVELLFSYRTVKNLETFDDNNL